MFLLIFLIVSGELWNGDSKPDSSWVKINATYADVDTFTDDAVFDSTVTLSDGTTIPGYRSEARVDTFSSAYLSNNSNVTSGVSVVVSNGFMANRRIRSYINFNNGGDAGIFPLVLLADSGYIDSIQIVFCWNGTPPDTDIFLVFIADSIGGDNTYTYMRTNAPIDTIIAADINKDNCGEIWTFDIGIGYKLGCIDGFIYPYLGGYYQNDDGGGQFIFCQLIVFWEAFYKR